MLARTTVIASVATGVVLGALLLLLPVPGADEAPARAGAGAALGGSATSPVSAAGDSATAAAPAPPLVIENVRYFDGEALAGPASIVVRGARIERLAAADADVATADGAVRIDGTGLTALPGLIDAHVHVFGRARAHALRFGVTTVVDMFTDPVNLRGMREDRRGDGPRDTAALFSAGMLATVARGHGTQYGVAVETLSGPEEAPAWVAERLAEGSDFIKLVYMPRARRVPSLDLATARAVIDAAHEAGVMAVAHISSLEGARDLLEAGVDGLVHVFADAPVDDAFIDMARQRGLFVVPTLAVIATVDGQSTGPDLIEDPELGPRLGDAMRGNLRQSFGGRVPGFDLDTALDNVGRLHAAGIPILAGSDAPNPGTVHGATLHAELALLVQAGLSPAEALAGATSRPARLFAATGRGVIEAGARADLVLVEGDPTRDIRATRALRAVIRNGRPVQGAGAGDGAEAGAGAVAGTAQGPARDAAPLTLPEVLGDFDTAVTAPQGLVWADTSDAMMGGSSRATLRRVNRGRGGALEVDATVSSDFAYPWAGAYLGPASDDAWADLGDVRAIAFDVRGTPATYRLMMFASGSFGAPPTAEFTVNEGWQRVEIPLERFADFTSSRFSGMAFVTPMASGDYRFALDDVRLVR